MDSTRGTSPEVSDANMRMTFPQHDLGDSLGTESGCKPVHLYVRLALIGGLEPGGLVVRWFLIDPLQEPDFKSQSTSQPPMGLLFVNYLAKPE